VPGGFISTETSQAVLSRGEMANPIAGTILLAPDVRRD